MKKIIIAISVLIFTAIPAFAQRTVKSVKFDGVSLNMSPDNFLSRLEKKGWKSVSTDSTPASQEDGTVITTTLEGKVNGIAVSATVTPNFLNDKVVQVIMFTEADQTLNKTRYDVIKSWFVDMYGTPAVEDLEMDDNNLSCYWGDFKKGDRDLDKNYISLITAESSYVVATLYNRENRLNATMNSIGDAVENVGEKISQTGKKTRESANKVSKKAKKIAGAAAEGAKNAWQTIKDAVKRK